MSPAARGARGTHARLVGLVLVGGALGTSLRSWLEDTWGQPSGWPGVTFAINLVGSFLLGLLLESLVRGGPDEGRRRAVRLGCGTGVLGGFTTYSTFVLEVHRLDTAGEVATAVVYPLVSVVLGVVCAVAGMWLASRRRIPTSDGPVATGDGPVPRSDAEVAR